MKMLHIIQLKATFVPSTFLNAGDQDIQNNNFVNCF